MSRMRKYLECYTAKKSDFLLFFFRSASEPGEMLVEASQWKISK